MGRRSTPIPLRDFCRSSVRDLSLPSGFGALALTCALGAATTAYADAIPYPTPGVINPTTYTFTAAATGDITAYFAGSTASFDNQLGLLVNGVQQGGFALDNHTSALGLAHDFGAVTAGDTLVFILHDLSLGMDAYSDPSMNGPYDGGVGFNHVYSTAYTGAGPVIDSIPAGTFVSFEDLPAYWPPDWNYNDEDFVFTNVASTQTPEPASLVLLGTGLLATVRRLRNRRGPNA